MILSRWLLTISSEIQEAAADVPAPFSADGVSKQLDFPRGEPLFRKVRAVSVSLGRRRRALSPHKYLADGVDDFPRVHRLHDMRPSSGLQSGLRVQVAHERRNQNHASFRKLGLDRRHHFHSTGIMQPRIHQGDVRSMLAELLQRFGTAGCFRDKKHVRLVMDYRGHPFSKKWVIINT